MAMGRAIVRDPQVFLFDEPLSNLDAKLRVQMRGEIRELHRRLGTTCIYVTHDQIEAMTMADRIVVMHDGVVEQVGAPLELYDRPANLFVASFLGSPAMNFIAGRLTAAGAFISDDGSVTLSPQNAPRRPGAQVICGFRPEAIVLDPNSPLRLHVTLTEPTGAGDSRVRAHPSPPLTLIVDISGGGCHPTSVVGAILPSGHGPFSSRHLPLTSAAFQPLGYGYLPATSRISHADRLAVTRVLRSLTPIRTTLLPAPTRSHAAGRKRRTAWLLRRR